VENVRLIYEQIELAKANILRADTLNCRLALILLDNAAELLMGRVLREEFAFADYFYPPGRERRLDDELKPPYSPEEREAALWEFEPKLRLLGHHLKKITAEERAILKICHRLRNETFHAGTLRHRILAQTTVLLFQTVVVLSTRFPVGPFVLPGGRPARADADFLARFEVGDAADLAFDQGRERVARKLLEGITLDGRAFAEMLTEDLVSRIDEHILGGLHTLNDGRDADIDRNLQYGQFWQEQGIALAKAGVRLPELDHAFERWQAAGNAKYTLHKIEKWRQHTQLISRRDKPSKALEEWYALDQKIQPLEEGIGKAVVEYEDRINAEIHDRRR
jgi:hypothetical protein